MTSEISIKPPVDALAEIFRKHVLRVSEVIEDITGSPVDRDTGDFDREALWRAMMETGRKAAALRRGAKRAQVDEAALEPENGVKRRLPDIPTLSALANMQPDLFPRARDATPEERNRALLLDYHDQLEEVSTFIDEYSKPEFFRKMIAQSFQDNGLTVDRREGRSGSVFVLTKADTPGLELKCATYVALKKNRFQQVSFGVRHLDDPSIAWVLLSARPLRKVYLLRASEILKRLEGKSDASKVECLSFTIRKGTPDTWLFESRIRELVGDFNRR